MFTGNCGLSHSSAKLVHADGQLRILERGSWQQVACRNILQNCISCQHVTPDVDCGGMSEKFGQKYSSFVSLTQARAFSKEKNMLSEALFSKCFNMLLGGYPELQTSL